MLEDLIKRLEAGHTVSVSGAMLKNLKYAAHHLQITPVARTGTQYSVVASPKTSPEERFDPYEY